MIAIKLTGEQVVKAYRSMCIVQAFGECTQTELTSGQIPSVVRPDASTYRGHGHSIEEGAEP